jgi:hypothetical protein
MADYYTRFSFEIPNLTDGERTWLEAKLQAADEAWENDEVDAPEFDFGWSLEAGGSLWVHTDESGTPESAANLCEEFLAEFRPHQSIGFEWANTCSKPRTDAFGGGAVFVTATEQRWMGSGNWLAQQTTGVVNDRDSGVKYVPWSDGSAAGFRCETSDGKVEYVYLNPSGGSDDGVATVFLYWGTAGDPAQDAAITHVAVGEP